VIGAQLRQLAELVWGRPWRAQDAVVVLTGAAGGIGSALALRLASAGATLALVDRDPVGLEQVRLSLPVPASTGHTTHEVDVLDEEQVAALARELTAHHGRIDVLVNNTGMTSAQRFADRSVASMVDEVMLNTISPLAVTKAMLPLLRRSADPRVVTTVSLAGMMPQAETPLYCASKFGLRGAMLSVALDLRAEGITVSCVLPSATDTRMLRQEALDGGNVLQFQHPPQQPEDVVRAVVSLLRRPRLEAYPRAGEARQVRAIMAFPNLLPVLLPLFEKQGQRGVVRYLDELRRRGDVLEVDGREVLA